MSTLRDIRKRLKSAQNVKQITRAVEMVAAVHFRKAQIAAEASRPYTQKMREILDNLSYLQMTHPLLVKRTVSNTILIVITADKGLAGSYNSAILLAADKFLAKYNPKDIELVLIGNKAVDYYERKRWKIRHRQSNWTGKIKFNQIEEIASRLMTGFLSNEFDAVYMLYTQFINILSRRVVLENYFSIEKPANEKKRARNYIFEPDAEKYFAEIIPRYYVTKLQSALKEAYASELSARIIAMKAAAKNADEMIDKLRLKQNKVRQTGITREIIEITSGAQALN